MIVISPVNVLSRLNNKHQGGAKKVLCVCSAGMLRSPSMAFVLQKEYGYNTRSAGILADFALIPVSTALLQWADEILCSDFDTETRLISEINKLSPQHGAIFALPKIKSLSIPDDFEYMNTILQEIIVQQYERINRAAKSIRKQL